MYQFYVTPANAYRSQKELITPAQEVYDKAVARFAYAPNFRQSWFRIKLPNTDQHGFFLEPEMDGLKIGDRVSVELDVTSISGDTSLEIEAYGAASQTDDTSGRVVAIDPTHIRLGTHHFKATLYIDERYSKAFNGVSIPRFYLNIRITNNSAVTSETVLENVKISVFTSNQEGLYASYDNDLTGTGDIWRALIDNKNNSNAINNESYSTTYDALKAKTKGYSISYSGGLQIPLSATEGDTKPFKGVSIQHIPYQSNQTFSGYVEFKSPSYLPLKLRRLSVNEDGTLTNSPVDTIYLKPDVLGSRQYFYFNTESLFALKNSERVQIAYFNFEIGDRLMFDGYDPFTFRVFSARLSQSQTIQFHKYQSEL